MSRAKTAAYWGVTGVFCLQMAFTAYAQLAIPDVAKEFARLGFPDYFRIELTILKLVGVLVVLVPMIPARLKEWAYAGFTITLCSAVLAHLACGDGAEKWSWSAGTLALGAGSYWLYRRREAALARA